jgi:protein arginine kinase activator
MQCEKCTKYRATVHLTEINEGKRTEVHLCEQCAQKEGVVIKTQPQLSELLNALLSSQNEGTQTASAADKLTCPQCGMTFKQFRDDFLLGCPHDYQAFSEPLKAIIEKSQAGSARHCGKVPSRGHASGKKQAELMTLRTRLDSAIKSEDYETAAKLRDRIKTLEKAGGK